MIKSGMFNHAIVSLLLAAAGMELYGLRAPADSPARWMASEDSANPPGPSTPVAQARDQVPKPVEGATTVIDARPAALVNGQSIAWGELRPILNELAGAQALQELILDRQISRALGAAGLSISADDVAAERKMLLESLNDDPNVALRLLDELRNRQNLGKTRFEALMRRNAGLRALVRGQVNVTDEALRTMHEMVHGPRRQARIMVVPDLNTAEAAINLIKSGMSFSDVAVEMSTDASASRGGLLEPINQADLAYPEALRQTLWTLNPGEMSGPVLIDDRYAVVMLVKRVAGDGLTLEEARSSLERLVRISQERLLMDQLARKILSDTQVTVFDEALHESWSRRTPADQ